MVPVSVRATHTYAVLDISPAAFEEIHRLLEKADYHHCFIGDVIDMHGIALRSANGEKLNFSVIAEKSGNGANHVE